MIMHEKRGQVAIFVIIALVIVGAVLVMFLVFPNISEDFCMWPLCVSPPLDPHSFLVSCIDNEIQDGIENLSVRGGYMDPEGSILYNNYEVKYLCYTSQYYEPCVVQQPMIKQHFEQELGEIVETKAEECISEMKEKYTGEGFSISTPEEVETFVEIYPERVYVRLDAPITITGDATQSYNKFEFVETSGMYSILMIATSIVEFEAVYGDSETTAYTSIYPNVRIGKDVLTGGTTIYTIEDVVTGEAFTFASRGLAWPGGFGT